ncbi:MAG: hypothetical protein ACFFAE_17300 [Candidatus Hodarchaeota archaeon]
MTTSHPPLHETTQFFLLLLLILSLIFRQIAQFRSQAQVNGQ